MLALGCEAFATSLQPFAYFHLCCSRCPCRYPTSYDHDFTTPLEPFGHFHLDVLAYVGLSVLTFYYPSRSVCWFSFMLFMVSGVHSGLQLDVFMIYYPSWAVWPCSLSCLGLCRHLVAVFLLPHSRSICLFSFMLLRALFKSSIWYFHDFTTPLEPLGHFHLPVMAYVDSWARCLPSSRCLCACSARLVSCLASCWSTIYGAAPTWNVKLFSCLNSDPQASWQSHPTDADT